jgi:hypothetical protein
VVRPSGDVLPAYPFLALAITASFQRILRRVPDKKNFLASAFLIVLLLIPIIRFATSKRHRTMDYYPHLKEISLQAKNLLARTETLHVHGIGEIPVIMFYSQRRISVLEGEDPDATRKGLIVLVPSRDDALSALRQGTAKADVLEENERYALVKLVDRPSPEP